MCLNNLPLILSALSGLEGVKGALEEIQKLGEEGMRPDHRQWLLFHEAVANIARTALADIQRVTG